MGQFQFSSRPVIMRLVVAVIAVLSLLAAGAAEEYFIANQPKFQVLSRNELAVDLPLPVGRDLVTFRMGLQRSGMYIEDVEWGTNDVTKNGKALIRDDRLRLKDGDVINYLFGFRDHEGYQAQTGQYIFDGVFKRSRAKRQIETEPTEKSTSSKSEGEEDISTDEGESSLSEARFGGGKSRNWGNGCEFNHQVHGLHGSNKKCNDDFNPFADSGERSQRSGFPNQRFPPPDSFGSHHKPAHRPGFPNPAFPPPGHPGPGFPGQGHKYPGQFYPRPHHQGGYHHNHHHGGQGHRNGGYNNNGHEWTTEVPYFKGTQSPRRSTHNPDLDYPDIDIRISGKN